MLIYCGLILTMGLRDKVVFLSSRAEQYVPTLLCFALFTNFVDMITVAKIFIVVIWMGAGFSKFNHGFSSTVAIMVQHTPRVVWDTLAPRRPDFPHRHLEAAGLRATGGAASRHRRPNVSPGAPTVDG